MTATNYYINNILIPLSSNPVVNIQWETLTNSTAEILITGSFSETITTIAFEGEEITIGVITSTDSIEITGIVYSIVNRTGSSRIAISSIEINAVSGTTGSIVIGPSTSVVGNIAIFSNTTGNSIIDSGHSTSEFITAPIIHSSNSKYPPIDADEVLLLDSATSFSLKKLTWTNIKSTLKIYFDTLYDAYGSALSLMNTHLFTFDHSNIHESNVVDGDIVNVSGKGLNDVLIWSGSQWIPIPLPSGVGVNADGGDSAITSGNNSVTVTHSLGIVPEFIGITPMDGFDAPYEIYDRTIASFKVRYKGGILQEAGTTGTFTWSAGITPQSSSRYVITSPIVIHHDDTSPIDLLIPTPAQCEIVKVTWFPTEDFNGSASTINIGEDSNHSVFLDNGIITKTVLGGPVHQIINSVYNSSINVRCWITPGAGCTTGEGKVIIQYINMV